VNIPARPDGNTAVRALDRAPRRVAAAPLSANVRPSATGVTAVPGPITFAVPGPIALAVPGPITLAVPTPISYGGPLHAVDGPEHVGDDGRVHEPLTEQECERPCRNLPLTVVEEPVANVAESSTVETLEGQVLERALRLRRS
jgi:hypothetical protein